MTCGLWFIGGSDCCSGSGIQKDLVTAERLGVHASTVLTSISAQNPQHVLSIKPVSIDMFIAQIQALQALGIPRVVKIGLMLDADHITYLANWLREHPAVFCICDLIFKSSSGYSFVTPIVIEAMRQTLFSRADLVIFNIDEAKYFSECSLNDPGDFPIIGRALHQKFSLPALVIKGGNLLQNSAIDYFFNEEGEGIYLSFARLKNESKIKSHGTGCCFASAIAATLVKGHSLNNAVVYAKSYLYSQLQYSTTLPNYGAIAMPIHFTQLPEISWQETTQPFKRCHQVNGIYCIIDRASWIEKLAQAGIRLMQLRIKTTNLKYLCVEIKHAIKLARQHQVTLYINDHWALAIEYNAYGVHLGQEDLDHADLKAIAKAGLRLGISTHDHFELVRAISINPSYIALGPIFNTTNKSMQFLPQGDEMIQHWKSLINTIPLVAIGGIRCSDIKNLIDKGANAVGLVSQIIDAKDPIASAYQCIQEVNKDEIIYRPLPAPNSP
jgi:hydroxymethylpyrimidine kinase/phosphomethylpyrimidine kinase/thiamine-phosphate diphosphorylase